MLGRLVNRVVLACEWPRRLAVSDEDLWTVNESTNSTRKANPLYIQISGSSPQPSPSGLSNPRSRRSASLEPYSKKCDANDMPQRGRLHTTGRVRTVASSEHRMPSANKWNCRKTIFGDVIIPTARQIIMRIAQALVLRQSAQRG